MQPTTFRLRGIGRGVFSCFCLLAIAAHAQTADNLNPSPAGNVTAIAVQPDNAIVIGGKFPGLCQPTNSNVARLNADGSCDAQFNASADDAVNCVAIQTDGKILVGGGFTQLNGAGHPYLGRLNADGTLDTNFNATVNSNVWCLALQPDGKILVGGSFTNVNGAAHSSIVRLNSDGTTDTSFVGTSTDVISSQRAVYSVALQTNGSVIIGGDFLHINGTPVNRLARLNSSGALDSTFVGGTSATVRSVAVQPNGMVLVAGSFSAVYTNTSLFLRTNIARFNSNGTLDSTFNVSASQTIWATAILSDGTILLAGDFTNVFAQSRQGIARVAAGSLDTTFNAHADGSVFALATQVDGKIIAGGSFQNFCGVGRPHLARINSINGAADALSYDSTSITWTRLGTAGEPVRVMFQASTNAVDWTDVGIGIRSNGSWLITNVDLSSVVGVKAQAFVAGGQENGSASLWERTAIGNSPTIAVQPVSRTVDASSTAYFGVGVSGAVQMYQWFKDGVAMTDGNNVFGSQSPRLSISSVYGTNSGQYTVVVSSDSGSETGSAATLTVRDPVITSVTNTQVSLQYGFSTSFSVTAVGTTLAYQWLKDGAPLAAKTNSSITASSVTGASAGNYSVVVTSPFNTVTALVATLTVADPYISAQPRSQTWTVGTAASISVSASGSQPLTYQWRKDGAAIPQATQSIYSVTKAQGTDAGAYDVVITGPFSTVTSSNVLVSVNGALVDTFNPFSTNSGGINAMALKPDNSLLLGVGNLVWRFDANGNRDTSFSPTSNWHSDSIALLPDTKFLLGIEDFLSADVKRYFDTGSVDSSYALKVNAGSAYIFGLGQQADGSVIVGGWFTNVAGLTRSNIARINPDGTFDTTFPAGAAGYVDTLALQPDGRILAGGYFTSANGQPRRNLARFNQDGTLDTTFNCTVVERPTSTPGVYCLCVQPDGKIIIGGAIMTVAGHSVSNIARINADGSFDGTFSAIPDDMLTTMSLQCDGRLLVGGTFTHVTGQSISGICRLNSDGSVDPTFIPNPNANVHGLALQTNGAVLVNGGFTIIAGSARGNFARLINPTPASQSISFDGSTIIWLRGGSAPEAIRTIFDISYDNVNWVTLGAGSRIAGGWTFSSVPAITNGTIRARGIVSGGGYNGSSWIVESKSKIVNDPTPPVIVTSDGLFGNYSNLFGFNISGTVGQVLVVEGSPDLQLWNPIATNLLTSNIWYFSTPTQNDQATQFYRARLR